MRRVWTSSAGATLASLLCLLGCSDTDPPETTPTPDQKTCQATSASPDYLEGLGCEDDFLALASQPLDASIPGARSVKVVLDQYDENHLYFQNSVKYQIHHDFASAKLSKEGIFLVPALSEFNETEYFSPDRRFLLGALTHYEGPDVWVLEIAPYDTMSAAMVTTLLGAVRAASWLGDNVSFHPTSDAVTTTAQALDGVTITTTDQIYAGISYQPLNLATAMGRLRFITAAELETTYVSFREIVVMDTAPNDISVVSGIITEDFQTPLSHINVLSRNRNTPNMGLHGARSDETLRSLEGKWVELVVGPFEYKIREVTEAEADTWWDAHKPTPVVLPPPNFTVRTLANVEDIVVEGEKSLREAIKEAVYVYGGKAAHYSILAKTDDVPVRKAFAIPAVFYDEFMEQNGLWDRLDAMTADAEFRASPRVRDEKLAEFRQAIQSAPIDVSFQTELRAKLAADFPGLTMRFRSSTNSEDLDAFPCAGCYESHTGDPSEWVDVLDAIRETWASIFLFRTFEEREYYSIDHKSVVMALLVHHNFPDEEANGVAVTANPFDTTGSQPGFFVNVQYGGDVEVVHPPAGTSSDQIVYLFDQPGQPATYISHSNLVDGAVLTSTQLYELGKALSAIHSRFSPAYGPASGNAGWYAMDVEFKFDGNTREDAKLLVKQARPYPEK